MAGRIRDEDIQLVRERSVIDEVVGEYLQLRSAGGGSLKGLCPFHDEKTPSFNVTPARGLWYCFSCSEGGDVIKFVQQIDNLNFASPLESLQELNVSGTKVGDLQHLLGAKRLRKLSLDRTSVSNLGPIAEFFGKLTFRPPSLPIYSCASRGRMPDSLDGIRELAVAQCH